MQNRLSKTTAGFALSLVLFSANVFAQVEEQIKVALVGPVSSIKVALIGPISGNKTQYGEMQMVGAQAAIEMINARGGVAGKSLQAVIYDDACDPEQAVAVANQVVKDGIDYVVGHLCSNTTQAAAKVYAQEGILMITPASTSPAITEQGHSLVFRTIGLDSDQGPTAARYISERIQPERVAILHDQQQYGQGLARTVRDQLKQQGIKVALFKGVEPGETDFSALLEEIQRQQISMVYYGGYHPELALILRQATEKGLDILFMGPEGVGNKDLTAHAGGAAAEGLLVTLPKKYNLMPANQAVVDHITAQQLDTSNPYVWTSYAAVQSLAAALEEGANNGTEVAAFLRAQPVETVMGELAWDAKGDLTGFNFGIYRWHADSTSTLLPH